MKRIFMFLCFLMCSSLLSSCGGKSVNLELMEDSGAQQSTDLVLWTFPVGNWGNPTAVASMIADFHKQYPNINISVEYLNYDSGDEKISEAVLEGTMPNLVLEGPERLVASWGEQGWLVDLSDLWESDKSNEIYKNIKTACQHKSGAYYVFPLCMSAHCMAINYDMFQQAGALPYIDQETHTWTTDGFIKAVETLTSHGQKNVGTLYCKNQSGDQGTRALVNNLYGGSFTDDTHTFYTVDSEENEKALRLLYDLDGITFDPTLSSAEAIDQFCKKETAMCFCWNVSIEVLQTINHPDLDFEVFPIAFPTDQGEPKLQSGIWGFGIFDNGDEEQIQASKTFIRYITENDIPYARAVRASSYWPVREIDNIYENDVLMAEYGIFTPYMDDYYQITPGWAEARTSWYQMLAKIGYGTSVSEAVKSFSFPN